MRKEEFEGVFKGRVAIVGIGNALRGDDGAGPLLVSMLQGKVDALCLDAGPSPESFSGKIVQYRPDTVLLIDSVHLGLAPGESALLRRSDLVDWIYGTHDVSLNLFIEYLQARMDLEVLLLGIQPRSVRLGAEMSGEVAEALEKLSVMLSEVLNARKPFN